MKIRPILLGIAVGFALTQVFNILGNFTIWLFLSAEPGYNWVLTIAAVTATAAIPFLVGSLYAVLLAETSPFVHGLTTGLCVGFYYAIPAVTNLAKGFSGILSPGIAVELLQSSMSTLVVSLALGILMGATAAVAYVRIPVIRSLRRLT